MDQITLDLLSDSIPIPKECEATIKQLHASTIFDDEELCANQYVRFSHLVLSTMNLLRVIQAYYLVCQNMWVITHMELCGLDLLFNTISLLDLFIALGSKKQRDALYKLQKEGTLGCFAFTECGGARVLT